MMMPGRPMQRGPMQRGPMQGGPPQQPNAGGDPMEKLQGMRSPFNPTDAAMDSMEGKFDPNMTVIELLQQVGIDPTGPATQLRDMFMQQMKNADPINKMMGLAQGAQAGRPPAGGPMPPARGPAPQGGMPQQPVGQQFDKLFNQ